MDTTIGSFVDRGLKKNKWFGNKKKKTMLNVHKSLIEHLSQKENISLAVNYLLSRGYNKYCRSVTLSFDSHK